MQDLFLRELEGEINEQDNIDLKHELGIEEVKQVVFSFGKGKAPGLDGLPIEFYQTFWEEIKDDLMEMLRECLELKRLGKSMREGLITILYKNKGDRNDLRNWRPITLLNCDYKILSKIVMGRLQQVTGELINPDQVCGVPGRTVVDNLNLIRDTCLYSKERGHPLCLINIDQEKAYDRVDHEYLYKVFEYMGFNPIFIDWVKMFFQKVKGRVVVNGMLSQSFQVNSGVRQGCPLSPLLYIFALEPVLSKIRRSKQVAGVIIPGSGQQEVRVLAYMDDVSLICRDNYSVSKALDIMRLFERASGSKINIEKSHAMCIGDWKEKDTIKKELTVEEDGVKVLGVIFDKDINGIRNWVEVSGKLKKKIEYWKSRKLTLEGKLLILKMILIPTLLYVARVFPPDFASGRTIIRHLFKFFWGGGFEKVKRETVMLRRNQGGKGFPNVIYYLWAHFVCNTIKAVLEMNKKYSFFARFYFGQFLRKMGLVKLTYTVPYGENMPFIYRKTMNFIVQNNLCKDAEAKWTAKDLMKKKESGGKLCRIGLLSDERSQIIWENVNYVGLNNRHKDIAWLTAQARLPCKELLYRRQMSNVNTCVRTECMAIETLQHVFYECVFAKQCWGRVNKLSRKFIRDKDMCVNLILHGPKKGIQTNDNEKGWIIINCVKEALWIVRNQEMYKSKNKTNVNEFCKIVIVKIRDYVCLDINATGKSTAFKKWKMNSFSDLFL